MAEKNIIVPDIQVHHPQESQQSQLKKITNKETTVDPIRYLAVMKLARFVFAHNSFTRRAI